MSFEFPTDRLTSLHRELGLENWIKHFHRPMPILGKILLSPLSKKDALERYQELREVKEKLLKMKLKTEDLLAESEFLPSLDTVFNAMRNQSMELVDHHRLGDYLNHELRLLRWEKKLSKSASNLDLVNHLLAQLDGFLENNFGSLRLSAHLLEKQEQLLKHREELNGSIKDLERQVLTKTGLEIRYGYPRHLYDADTSRLECLKELDCIELRHEEQKWIARIHLTPLQLQLQSQIEQLEHSLNLEYNQLLGNLNQKIESSLPALEEMYQHRRKKTLLYILLATSERLQLTIPELCDAKKIRLVEAKLPIMEEYTQDYVPLNFEMRAGANLLVGANMSGKTTILKTIFFMTTLVQYGLPVPAKALEIHFPETIYCHLPGTGDLRKNLSALGAELEFWSTKFTADAFILVDEMFHSTDPVSGVFLTRVFLEECRGDDRFLLATTHFNEVLKFKHTTFFRMTSSGRALQFDPGEEPMQSLGQEALHSALKFSLPNLVKSKIKKRLKTLEPEPDQ